MYPFLLFKYFTSVIGRSILVFSEKAGLNRNEQIDVLDFLVASYDFINIA